MATAVTEAVAMASVPTAAAGGGATPQGSTNVEPLAPLGQYQQHHELERASLLSQQQQRWWQDVAECSQAYGCSGTLQQQLLLQPQQ
jgi:hypothetical protein